jgi:CDP-paratose 2-epimerase
MRIGITGGCGFVGSNLAERFALAGHDVTVLDNLTREGSYLNLERLKKYRHPKPRRFRHII